MIPDIDNDSIVYLNGDYIRLADAKISVLDRGFIFGDGVYDVVPAYNGRAFRMHDHLDRLQRSLDLISIHVDLQRKDWESLVNEMLHSSNLSDCMVYIHVTRGVAKRDHPFPKNTNPTIFCMVSPFTRPTETERTIGLTAISIPDIRWLRCEIKSISLLGNVLAKQAAIDAGVNEVIQFRDGYLTEGASNNVWVVIDKTLLAPPRNNLILEGIRYSLMQELAAQSGIKFESRPITEEEINNADEIMVTSATREVLPITQLNDKPVGNGQPGAIYKQIRANYDQAIKNLEQA